MNTLIDRKNDDTGHQIVHKEHFPKNPINLLPIAFGNQVTHTRHDATHHRTEKHSNTGNDHRVVAIVGHHLQRDKGENQNLIALLQQEILDFMYKYLLGLPHDLRILMAHLLAHSRMCRQPRIGLPNLPIQDNGMDDTKPQLDRYPEIQITDVIDRGHLHEGLDEGSCLEIGGYHIVLLIGIEENRAVIDEVAYQRGGQKGPKGKIDDA